MKQSLIKWGISTGLYGWRKVAVSCCLRGRCGLVGLPSGPQQVQFDLCQYGIGIGPLHLQQHRMQ